MTHPSPDTLLCNLCYVTIPYPSVVILVITFGTNSALHLLPFLHFVPVNTCDEPYPNELNLFFWSISTGLVLYLLLT